MSKTKLVETLWNCNCVKIDTENKFSLKGNDKSPYYFDLRQVISHYNEFMTLSNYVSETISNCIKKNNVSYDKIAGVPLGGIPIATNIARNLEANMVMPRSERKKYGRKNEIEGNINVGDEIILIEDVITTGNSVLETIKMIERNGGLVSLVVVIFDRDCGGLENIKNNGYNVICILDINYLVDNLVNKGLINEFEYEAILNFTNLVKNKFIKSIKDKKNNEENVEENELSEETSEETEEEEKMKHKKRKLPEILNHKLRATILELMYNKKSNLCLSLNTSTWEKAKELLDKYGEKVVMVETFVESYDDFDDNFGTEIKDYAAKHKFLVIENSNICDNDVTSWNKMMYGKYKIDDWASFVTILGLNVGDILDYYKSRWDGRYPVNVSPCVNASLENNVKNSSESYNKLVNLQLEHYKDVICSENLYSPVIICENFQDIKSRIKMTHLNQLEITQNDIDKVILEMNNHVIMVGKNSLIDISDEEFDKLVKMGWDTFSDAFPNLVKDIELFENDLNEDIETLKKRIEEIENQPKLSEEELAKKKLEYEENLKEHNEKKEEEKKMELKNALDESKSNIANDIVNAAMRDKDSEDGNFMFRGTRMENNYDEEE